MTTTRIAIVVLAATLALIGLADSEPGVAVDPVAALTEGNRLFGDSRLEEAIEAYRAGWDAAAVHPTLAYNLGTTLHHLGRLPEAILWYRRAGDGPDPWIDDNLWLARRTLGSQTLPPGGIDGVLARWGQTLGIAGIVVAWLVAGSILFPLQLPRWSRVGLAALALVLYGTAEIGTRYGARPAILLTDCSTAVGDLPAGTEAWVRPLDDDRWRIAAESADAICPGDAVVLIDPR